MRGVISISGGMDSTCLLIKMIRLGFDVDCFSFDYGQKHKIELERLEKNLKYIKKEIRGIGLWHTRINLKSAMRSLNSALISKDIQMPEGHYADANMKRTVVPNRNAIFSSIIYAHAQSIANIDNSQVSIALGVHSGDHEIYPDCREDFYEQIGKAFHIGNWNSKYVSFYLPYLQMDKAQILEQCLIDCEWLELDFDTILSNTNTSYLPDEQGRAHGKTGSDVERILAFHKIGRKDPVEYQDTWENVLKYALEQEKAHAK